ncbi:MAG: hypothetical protein O2816_04320 [Planctomycetota bacterium]|nr:hypothetical protein [Planctomycetota bacterium]
MNNKYKGRVLVLRVSDSDCVGEIQRTYAGRAIEAGDVAATPI